MLMIQKSQSKLKAEKSSRKMNKISENELQLHHPAVRRRKKSKVNMSTIIVKINVHIFLVSLSGLESIKSAEFYDQKVGGTKLSH